MHLPGVQALNKHQPHLVVVEPVVWCLSIFAAARPITLRRLNVVEVRALPPHYSESPVLAPRKPPLRRLLPVDSFILCCVTHLCCCRRRW